VTNSWVNLTDLLSRTHTRKGCREFLNFNFWRNWTQNPSIVVNFELRRHDRQTDRQTVNRYKLRSTGSREPCTLKGVVDVSTDSTFLGFPLLVYLWRVDCCVWWEFIEAIRIWRSVKIIRKLAAKKNWSSRITQSRTLLGKFQENVRLQVTSGFFVLRHNKVNLVNC
jgi:hypothetical protein